MRRRPTHPDRERSERTALRFKCAAARFASFFASFFFFAFFCLFAVPSPLDARPVAASPAWALRRRAQTRGSLRAPFSAHLDDASARKALWPRPPTPPFLAFPSRFTVPLVFFFSWCCSRPPLRLAYPSLALVRRFLDVPFISSDIRLDFAQPPPLYQPHFPTSHHPGPEYALSSAGAPSISSLSFSFLASSRPGCMRRARLRELPRGRHRCDLLRSNSRLRLL